MLLILMYHRVIDPGFACSEDALQQHFAYLSKNHPIVLPGDPLEKGKLSVCISFDDAYFDFFYKVYPLLKKLNMKAVLAVPTKYIIDSTDIADKDRLAVPYSECVQGDNYKKLAPFCTWRELGEMQASGHIHIASHSCNHTDLSSPNADFEKEIVLSKEILETKLKAPITSFVYPFGKTSREAHNKVMQHYSYAMRIGSALNHDWHNRHGFTYRIDAEHYWPYNKKFGFLNYSKYYMKYLSNTLRGK